RPFSRCLRERSNRGTERRLVPAFRGNARVLETRGQVLMPRDELFEIPLRLGIVLRSTLPLDLQRERIGGLAIVRVELQCAPPVLDRLGQIPAAAFRECLQSLDGGAVGRKRRRVRQLLRTLLQLLLPEQQQPEISETG